MKEGFVDFITYDYFCYNFFYVFNKVLLDKLGFTVRAIGL